MQNNIMNKFFDFYMESIKNEETGVSKEDLVNKAVQGVANETGKTVEEISTITESMEFPEISFVHKNEFCIVIPILDEDGRSYVEPYKYYGEPYNDFMMEFHKKRLNFLLRDTPYKVSIYQTDDWYNEECDEDEECDEEHEKNELPMFEGEVVFKNSEEELEDFITGRYCSLSDIVEELESLCEDAISELSPKDIQVAKCNNWIDWMDRLLIAESSLEAVAKARDDGKYRFLQISSDRVEVENVPLRKKLTFNFETLPTQEDAKLVLRELLMI